MATSDQDLLDAWEMADDQYIESMGRHLKLWSRKGKRGGWDYDSFEGKSPAECRAKAAAWIRSRSET